MYHGKPKIRYIKCQHDIYNNNQLLLVQGERGEGGIVPRVYTQAK